MSASATKPKLSEVVAAAKLLIFEEAAGRVSEWRTRAFRSCRCGHYHKMSQLDETRRSYKCEALSRGTPSVACGCARFVPLYAVALGLQLTEHAASR